MKIADIEREIVRARKKRDIGKALECETQIQAVLGLEDEHWEGANRVLLDETGRVKAEIDLENRHFIIECTNVSELYYDQHGELRHTPDKVTQVQRLVTDRKINPFKKEVVFVAPFYSVNEDLEKLSAMGVRILRSPKELRELLLQVK